MNELCGSDRVKRRRSISTLSRLLSSDFFRIISIFCSAQVVVQFVHPFHLHTTNSQSYIIDCLWYFDWALLLIAVLCCLACLAGCRSPVSLAYSFTASIVTGTSSCWVGKFVLETKWSTKRRSPITAAAPVNSIRLMDVELRFVINWFASLTFN